MENAAAVVILGFAHRESQNMRLRMEVGVAEYHSLVTNGRAVWLVVTGGDTQQTGETEATYMMKAAVANGVPASRILLEDQAHYTIENALFVRRLLEACQPPVSEVVLVTSAFHMARSYLIFSQVLPTKTAKIDIPCMGLRCLESPDGERLLEDTKRSSEEWRSAEEKQLAVLRSENSTEIGNVLSRRLFAHNHLGFAAKTGNIGAMDSWYKLSMQSKSLDSQPLRGGSVALHYAVLYRQLNAVKWLLERRADPNKQNHNGCTPLHFAFTIADDSLRNQVVSALSAAGANDGIVGQSALWEGSRSSSDLLAGSSQKSNLGVLPLRRLERIGSLVAFGDPIYTVLMEAARDGDVTAVQAWIDKHPDASIDGPNEGYSTALAHAASGGSSEVVRLLLEKRADVRKPREPRANPLHYAAFRMQRHCLKLLLQAPGASDALGARGNSSLWDSLGAVTPSELAKFNMKQSVDMSAEIDDISLSKCNARLHDSPKRARQQ